MSVKASRKQSNYKRSSRVLAAAVAVAAGVALSACGSSGNKSTTGGGTSTGNGGGTSSGSGKTVDISFWTTSSNTAETNYLISHFNATHKGIHVKGSYLSTSDQATPKIIAAIKSGSEPNVIIGQDPSQLPLFAESGKVVNLDGKLGSLTNQLYPGIKDALFYKGQQLGMALGGVGNYALFYNKKDFKAAGISKPPTTWPELIQDAIKLTHGKQYGVYIPTGAGQEWISYLWEGALWSYGGTLTNAAETKATFDSPAGVKALTNWVDLVQKYHAAPTASYAVSGSYDGAPAFAQNDVAMIFDGQFALSTFRQDKIDFGVSLMPAGSAGTSANIGIGVATEFDHGSTANAAATTFIDWLAQPAQGAYQTVQSEGLPSAPAQLTVPSLKAFAAKDWTYPIFAKQLKSGHTRPSVPGYAELSTDLSTEITAALQGKISPAAALAKAQQEGNQALASNG